MKHRTHISPRRVDYLRLDILWSGELPGKTGNGVDWTSTVVPVGDHGQLAGDWNENSTGLRRGVTSLESHSVVVYPFRRPKFLNKERKLGGRVARTPTLFWFLILVIFHSEKKTKTHHSVVPSQVGPCRHRSIFQTFKSFFFFFTRLSNRYQRRNRYHRWRVWYWPAARCSNRRVRRSNPFECQQPRALLFIFISKFN